jgi:hypothetical protein
MSRKNSALNFEIEAFYFSFFFCNGIRAVRASDFGTCLPSVEPLCVIDHDQNVNKSWAGHVDGGAI